MFFYFFDFLGVLKVEPSAQSFHFCGGLGEVISR